ncbi:gas vesicle protein GvpJ [Halalkalicoccus jeotgali]|uniref:Gas-vesicle operon protein gvpJ1 n=1 Tax=Halalkalicoccus jeotgali (strain DSM 18796 / CECT 7217 / JCM 14584 / KCTC 4019 / B3) TaxID=795797 RepID=D8J5P4_HALJB|nr:gas vesicle protein [Halalkalicoccus jeotgali]ADJ15740.1 gas-vesicle operon protein gvpJ1 [Halalkalicoccus jeotgali B3]ELY37236.1 gas-vesicle operon protein gvpJ1 [Halalkalicoccus jeotgali B3]
MSDARPTRQKSDLADVLELVLDKGIVINADIAVTVGETELLGIEIRAAIASFETAAEYGLAFPTGTDMRRVEQASGREPLEVENNEEVNLGINASDGGSNEDSDPPSARPDPEVPISTNEGSESGTDASDGDDGDGEDEPEDS